MALRSGLCHLGEWRAELAELDVLTFCASIGDVVVLASPEAVVSAVPVEEVWAVVCFVTRATGFGRR